MKYSAILAFVAIIASLGAALFFMLKSQTEDESRGRKMARALALRVGISIVLFVSILAAWKLGYIQPSGIVAGQ